MQSPLTFFGLPVQLRPIASLAGILNATIAALITRDPYTALAATILWYAADATHVAGHIASSHFVGAPMDGIDVGLFPKNVYHNQQVSPQQHIGRASGGVVASLLATLLWVLLARGVSQPFVKRLVTIAAIQHGMLAGASLLPVRFVDGGVIYSNLAKIRS